MNYTEDTLVQRTTADYLEQQLGWKSVYAWNNNGLGLEDLLVRVAVDRDAGDFCGGSLRATSYQIMRTWVENGSYVAWAAFCLVIRQSDENEHERAID